MEKIYLVTGAAANAISLPMRKSPLKNSADLLLPKADANLSKCSFPSGLRTLLQNLRKAAQRKAAKSPL